jgi:hypothetical protein
LINEWIFTEELHGKRIKGRFTLGREEVEGTKKIQRGN